MNIDLTVEEVEKRIFEATLVVVFDVYYCYLFKGIQLAAASRFFKRRVLYHFPTNLQHFEESKTRFVVNKFFIKFPDLIFEDPKGVDIRICESGDCSIAWKDARWFSDQLLL